MFDNDEAAITAAKLTTLAVETVNMAWMTRVARALHRDEVPFESPEEMARFADGATLLVTAFASGDRQAIAGVLAAIGCVDDARKTAEGLGERVANESAPGEFLSIVRSADSQYVAPVYREIIDEAVMHNPSMLG